MEERLSHITESFFKKYFLDLLLAVKKRHLENLGADDSINIFRSLIYYHFNIALILY